MQMTAAPWAILAVLVTNAACMTLRGSQQAAGSEESAVAAWNMYSHRAASDRRFWLDRWTDVETDLLHLLKAAKNTTWSQMAANVTKPEAIKPTQSKESAPKNATSNVSLKAPAQTNGTQLAGLPILTLSGHAALMPMLAMLKGMVEDTKEHIAEQNAREEKSKKWFATQEDHHKKKLAEIEAKHKKHELPEVFYTNETRDENRFFAYWERVRKRQHHQFHINLKIQHGMMQKAKSMIGMYEKALAGTADPAQMKQQLQAISGGMALLQVQKFVSDSLEDVRAAREEIHIWAQYDDTKGTKFRRHARSLV